MIKTVNTCDKDIGELAAIYDKNSKNTFVSLYFDGKERRLIRRREHTIHSVLDKDERDNFEKTMSVIKSYLANQKSFNIALFASEKYAFFKAVKFTIQPPNALIVDSSPYIKPLAEVADRWKPFTLVLLNSHHAKIYAVTCGAIEKEEELSAEIMNKHKKGGWSQARFQRLRKGSIHTFFLEVAEALQMNLVGKVILAGPGKAKHDFRKTLSKGLQSRIVTLLDTEIDHDGELIRDSINLMAETEKTKRRDILEQLKKEILTDGLAVYGIDDTKAAVKNGQVEMLVVEKNYGLKGWICEKCQLVGTGGISRCPNCTDNVSEVDVVEEIIEFAERTGAIVRFIEGDDMDKFGHIAAILRYK